MLLKLVNCPWNYAQPPEDHVNADQQHGNEEPTSEGDGFNAEPGSLPDKHANQCREYGTDGVEHDGERTTARRPSARARATVDTVKESPRA